MDKVLVKHLGEHAGREVQVQGWFYNKRSSGKIVFLIVRDGSGLVQGVVARQAVGEEVFALID